MRHVLRVRPLAATAVLAAGALAAAVPFPAAAAAQSNEIGYHVLTSNGGVHNYGAPWYGSGGYWIVKSNGGVDAFNAPWYGSLAWHVPAGQSVTRIAGE